MIMFVCVESKKRKKRVRLDPEGLALGSLIVQSKKMKRDLIENAYNRYVLFNFSP